MNAAALVCCFGCGKRGVYGCARRNFGHEREIGREGDALSPSECLDRGYRTRGNVSKLIPPRPRTRASRPVESPGSTRPLEQVTRQVQQRRRRARRSGETATAHVARLEYRPTSSAAPAYRCVWKRGKLSSVMHDGRRQHQWGFEMHDLPRALRIDHSNTCQTGVAFLHDDLPWMANQMIRTVEGDVEHIIV